MHLLLIEMDGPDCVADHRFRLQQVKASGAVPRTTEYSPLLYSPDLMAHDEPVPGAREVIVFLAKHAWHVVLLRSCRMSRETFHVTKRWLRTHGFDRYYFEWILKEQWYNQLSAREWKSRKVEWYGNEGGYEHAYQRIVYIDPVRPIREYVQAHWSSMTGCELETYSGLTEFCSHLTLGGARPGIEALLEQQRELDATVQLELVEASDTLEDGTGLGEGGREPLSPRQPVHLGATQEKPVASAPLAMPREDLLPEGMREARVVPEVILGTEAYLEPVTSSLEEGYREGPARDTQEAGGSRDESSTEALFHEDDFDEEEPGETVQPRQPRKLRSGKGTASHARFEGEEDGRAKKPAKHTQRERQAERSLKAAALIE